MTVLRKLFRVSSALVLSIGATAILILRADGSQPGSSKRTNAATCSADIRNSTANLPKPAETRLENEVRLFGYLFKPVEPSFEAKTSSRTVWHEFGAMKQRTAHYWIYLAKIVVPNHPGATPPFANQNVLFVLARHVAFVPEKAPSAISQPACVFGTSISVANATTGKEILSAG